MNKLTDPRYDICYQNGLNIRAIVLLTNHPQGIGGHRLKSIQIQFKEESCLIILKKTDPKGDKVAFIEATGLDNALWVMAREIKAKTLRWRDDRWSGSRT